MSSPDTLVQGERISLRAITTADVGEAYLRWMTDPDVVRFLESRFQQHSHDSLVAYVAARGRSEDSVMMAIVLTESGRHIGNIRLAQIAWPHGTADIGLLIGEKECWGQGYATEAIRLVCRYAFDQLGLRRLTASCYSTNSASARAFANAGFSREGSRPRQYVDRGVYVDQLLFGIEPGRVP